MDSLENAIKIRITVPQKRFQNRHYTVVHQGGHTTRLPCFVTPINAAAEYVTRFNESIAWSHPFLDNWANYDIH
jgi:hypothetical protein